MPGGDRTGPMGAGPMTGRGAGFCAGNTVAGYATGRGARRCRQGGWGLRFGMPFRGAWRQGRYPRDLADIAPTDARELDALKGQAGHLTAALKDITRRIEELEADRKAE